MIAENQTFTDRTIYLDGASFYHCKFARCRLTFSGAIPPHLRTPEFHDCQREFLGPAGVALGFLKQLSQLPGGNVLIESMFGKPKGEQIRSSKRRSGASNRPH